MSRLNAPRDFELALKIGACRVINVKPGRVGGLLNAVKIHDMARDAGVDAWVGGMLESGVGAGICAALGTLPGFNLSGRCVSFAQVFTLRILQIGGLSRMRIAMWYWMKHQALGSIRFPGGWRR